MSSQPSATYDVRREPAGAGGNTRAAPPGSPRPAPRLDSIDAYRGLVMFLMMAAVMQLSQVARAFPESRAWQLIGFNTQHVPWGGFSLHDLIQPGFSFLVGVSLPFSIASREARGTSFGRMLLHALWRGVVLTLLGVFLRSQGKSQTYFTFEDTLSQIGLGYVFLFLIGLLRIPLQILACVAILAAYWGAFALYSLPGADFDYPGVKVAADWPWHYSGFAAHWNKNSNLAWKFDTWFLNLFPREEPFTANNGGYSTLSFIPTLATMVLGSVAGGWLRLDTTKPRKVLILLAAAAVCLASGYALDRFGICPSVKPIWTPAWVLTSGGWCFLFLAGFYAVVDGFGWRRPVFPLIVIGANSLVAYCMYYWFPNYIARSFQIHLGEDCFRVFGDVWEPAVRGAAILLVLWLILFWMYRRKVFVRI
ncbi:MAG: acyltransferase family protein [Planctomycetaceae bacterium]